MFEISRGEVVSATLVVEAILIEVEPSVATSADVDTIVFTSVVVYEILSGIVVLIVISLGEVVSKDVEPVVAIELTSSVGVGVVDSSVVNELSVVEEMGDEKSAGVVDLSVRTVDVSIGSEVLSGRFVR